MGVCIQPVTFLCVSSLFALKSINAFFPQSIPTVFVVVAVTSLPPTGQLLVSWPIAALRRYGVNNVSLTIVTGRYRRIHPVEKYHAIDISLVTETVPQVKAGSNSTLSTVEECTVTYMPWPLARLLPRHTHCRGLSQR